MKLFRATYMHGPDFQDASVYIGSDSYADALLLLKNRQLVEPTKLELITCDLWLPGTSVIETAPAQKPAESR